MTNSINLCIDIQYSSILKLNHNGLNILVFDDTFFPTITLNPKLLEIRRFHNHVQSNIYTVLLGSAGRQIVLVSHGAKQLFPHVWSLCAKLTGCSAVVGLTCAGNCGTAQHLDVFYIILICEHEQISLD